MESNPFLKKLGFAPKDRVVILHADDVGMCYSSVSAFQTLHDRGWLGSGSTMVPCAWFPAVAACCRKRPDIDMGVHLTFTSEWENYRWGPLSTREPASGLLDEEGYFHRTAADARLHAEPDYIRSEVMAQIDRALISGIDVTHIDMHMGAMLHPKFLPAYLEAGSKYRIPMLAPRMKEERLNRLYDPAFTAMLTATIKQIEEDGFPLTDHFCQLSLNRPSTNRSEDLKRTLESLGPGLTHFIVHPAEDTPEVRAITPDWAGRVADFRAFFDSELREYLLKASIQLIGYRQLRDALR